MSATATAYVRRHLMRQVNRTKGALLSQLADVADDRGRTARYTQRDAAADMGAAPGTVKRAFRVMMRPGAGAPGPFLLKHGNGRYEIVGVAGHDQAACWNDECQDEAGLPPAGESPAQRRRRKAAARARAFRARKRALPE